VIAEIAMIDHEVAIRGLYEKMMDGWNRGSAVAFAEPVRHDAEFVAFDGTHFHGRDELVAFHEPLFQTHLKGTRLVGRVNRVRFLSEDVAVIHASGSTIMRGQSAPSPARDSIQTLVVKRSGEEWSVAAFQNTRVRPMARSIMATMLWLAGDWFWNFALCRRARR